MAEQVPANANRNVIVERYSSLAQAALAGEPIADCEAEEFTNGCFGAASYVSEPNLPDRHCTPASDAATR
jgi:hypothetical protein